MVKKSLYIVKHDPEPKIKARRKLIGKPIVTGYDDYKANGGVIRVLEREKASALPEFALYMKEGSSLLTEALISAGLIEEEKGKWVLRTDKFSIFIYMLTGR